jgi:hypothetical protein
METHVKVLAVLHIVFGAIGILIGVGVFALLGGIAHFADLSGDGDAAILRLVGGFVLFLMLILSVPGLAAGVGLLTYQPWSRILTIVLSIFELVNIPFGTALGVYGLWAMFTPEAIALFEQRSTSEKLHGALPR